MTEVTETATWEQVFAGEVAPEDIEPLLAESAQAIDEYLAADSETEEEALEVLRRRLDGPLEPTTYDDILAALRALIGNDGTGLVHWYVTIAGDDVARLKGNASPRVDWFLRRITAAHGPELQAAFSLWRDLPDDWKLVNREVFYDLVRERYYIRHRIFKSNGEQVVLEGNADSVLDLARSLLMTLRWVGRGDAFSEPVRDAFLDEVQEFVAMAAPQPATNGDEPAAS
jgi:hypothetical protein